MENTHTASKGHSTRTVLFWDVTQRVAVIQYHYSLCNNPEQRIPRLLPAVILDITRRISVLNLPVSIVNLPVSIVNPHTIKRFQ